MDKGWLRADPFAGLAGDARGKDQLRIDEARRYVTHALDEDSLSGLAAARF